MQVDVSDLKKNANSDHLTYVMDIQLKTMQIGQKSIGRQQRFKTFTVQRSRRARYAIELLEEELPPVCEKLPQAILEAVRG